MSSWCDLQKTVNTSHDYIATLTVMLSVHWGIWLKHWLFSHATPLRQTSHESNTPQVAVILAIKQSAAVTVVTETFWKIIRNKQFHVKFRKKKKIVSVTYALEVID